MTAPIRVLLVDDDHLMRAGLRAVLSSDDTVEVVGEAGDGREAIERARRLRPDVVLMDLRMPRLDGVAATRELLAVARRRRCWWSRPSRRTTTSSARSARARPASCSSAPGRRT